MGEGTLARPPALPGRRQHQRAGGLGLVAQSSSPGGPQLGSGRPLGDRRHSGCTPLHWAACNGHSELVQVLLTAGPRGLRPSPHPLCPTLLVTRLCGGLFAFCSNFSAVHNVFTEFPLFLDCVMDISRFSAMFPHCLHRVWTVSAQCFQCLPTCFHPARHCFRRVPSIQKTGVQRVCSG